MKSAILVVSFGTTYADTRKLTIERIEERVSETFSDYDVRTAFTSHMIIKVLKERDGITCDTPEEALDKLMKEGYAEVIVQPLHLIPGVEYDYVKGVVHRFKNKEAFNKIELGRPALYYKGEEEGRPDDYGILVDSIDQIIPRDKAVVFMGHGTIHYANACYLCLQSVFNDHGYENVYLGTVEGYPTLQDVIRKLKKDKIKEITLMPLMLVAGDHAKNDMASDEKDSWKMVLRDNGFKVNIYLHGLGEIPKFQEIYLEHIRDVIEDRYEGLGKTKK
ncbi:sirohydrochlorin cobaltochelatase [Clostridium sp.]|uniref:sirohydrochlorin cobaltochelatase n=1 Tax=Clostridium sp. TaxID=1506 RepID=UPI001A5CA2C9|nr:sirohydrochlorin cobaltochelatase [Clostridium sp.]MBK5242647.1 sirohydrochlorin cobaltochelatase [Clostridium sp.]